MSVLPSSPPPAAALAIPIAFPGIGRAQTVAYRVTNLRAGGFEAAVTITNTTPNTTPRPIDNWRLTFQSSRVISSIWNAAIESRSGADSAVVPARAFLRIDGAVSLRETCLAQRGNSRFSGYDII